MHSSLLHGLPSLCTPEVDAEVGTITDASVGPPELRRAFQTWSCHDLQSTFKRVHDAAVLPPTGDRSAGRL